MRSHTKQFSNNIENMQQLSGDRLSENRAIVIGGGIAGLIAARVLCNHFDQVTIVERDTYPEEVGPRNGTSQPNHAHVLLGKGRQILTDLFPGLERSLLAKGAHKIDLIANARFRIATGWALNFDSKMTTLASTRHLLEYALRKELRTAPSVNSSDTSAFPPTISLTRITLSSPLIILLTTYCVH
jgi:2-polyprenyl-6-methoxyphenol hydroxylase-like FAD-dependent oxidoreductase